MTPIRTSVGMFSPVRWRGWRRATAFGVAVVLAAGLLQAPDRVAVAAGHTRPEREPVPTVPVTPVKAAPAAVSRAKQARDKPRPVWPKAGTASVEVSPEAGPAVAKPGGLSVAASTKGSTRHRFGAPPRKVRVEVLDRAATSRSNIKGVLLSLAATDKSSGRMRVSVDYRSFATAYGADWASRLRLVALPACALVTPEAEQCAGTPLSTTNSLVARTVSAEVMVAPTASLLAVSAAASGPAGDYGATPLRASSTWSAGGNSGDFTWSYPMRVPPAPGGLAPELALSYSAQSVDGRHAATNNQPSWMGEGFEAWPGGYIERRYRACAKDMDGSANNDTETGDLCWETDNAVLSLAGHSGELIYNDSEGRWHLRADDGTRIERKTGASNGDNNGEHWVVTTTNGIQYWFGRNRLPGWTSGKPQTNSTWTAPVFGNDPGEPCHATAFADSDCTQAWRWNLDYVVDLNGNSISYWYGKETNRYGRNIDADDAALYDRGGWLDKIEYGTQNTNSVDSIFSTPAPLRVDFTEADRCLSSCTSHSESSWPDTPWDSECGTAPCTDNYSVTFWSTKRLASVTTQVRNGSGYDNVERWTFTHSFPDPGDGTRAGLWLDKISHAGLVGTTTTVPDVEFTPVQKPNRVDATGDFAAAMNWMRIAKIRTEAGGTISVTYSDADCHAGQPMPTPASNTRRCYPVIWEPEGYDEPVTDWFHKYVVTTIYEADNTGGVPPHGSPRVAYSYAYFDAAWHHADDDGIVDKDAKTWSDWRGYGRVQVTTGDPGEQTHTETRFFQGMHGDRASGGGGTRTVTIDGIADHDWYAGIPRESKTFNGPGGPTVTRVTNEPWASAPTATRTINADTVTARFTRIATTRSYTTLDGGRGERATRTTTTYDAYGMATAIDDYGHDGVTGDEQCTKVDYTPRNDAVWLMDRAHRVQTYARNCDATTGTLTDDDVIGDARTYYDGATTFETAPTRGLTTKTEEMAAWNGGAPTFTTTGQAAYDVHGRITSSRNALNYETTTAFTPATGGPVTSVTVTNPMRHTTTTTMSPAWGSVTSSVDANGKRTDLAFDGLGRITKVWRPDRVKDTDTASVVMDYQIRNTAASYVATSQLNADGDYVIDYSLYDGLLRPRQTQAPSPSGGRLITETFYDTVGRAKTTFDAYHTTGTPGGSLVTATERATVPTQTRTDYDGAGRVTATVFQPYDAERWRTSTYHAGDRTDVTPPAGGTATSTVTDGRGRITDLRQYHGPAPTPHTANSWDTTTYTYNGKGQTDSITDPAGNTWSYTYDLRGRQTQTTDPDRGTTTLTYDDADRVTTTTDDRGKKLAYLYDPLDRKRATYDNQVGGSMRAQWVYDTLAKGHLTQSTRFLPGSPSYQVRVTGYDDTYQPTGTQYVIPNTETGLSGTYNYTNSWNPDGSLASLGLPSTRSDLGPETLLYDYSDLGLPTTLTTLTGSTTTSYVPQTHYNALGQVEGYDLHSGSGGHVWRSFGRELETGRLTNVRTDRDSVAPHVLADTSYTYDPAGNITKIQDVAPDPADDTQCFTYDHLRRLTHAWTPASGDCTATRSTATLGGPAPYWNSWTFDTVGNRKTHTVHTGVATSTTTYHYPAAGTPRPHALTSTTGANTGSYTYDTTGNTLTRPTPTNGTQTFTWDAEGLLETATDATGQTRYIYDADGNRLIRRDPTGATLYLPGQEVRYSNDTGTTTCTRYYTHAGSTAASRTASGLTWLADDHQGTQNIAINAVTQASTTRRQGPYGDPRGSQPTWPNPKGFVNGDTEPTGLTRLGARHYDASIGRFISVDPIQDLAQPQQWQGYSYANNNPITFSDPSGLYVTGDSDGYVRAYQTSSGTYQFFDYTPKTSKTTASPPPLVVADTPNYTVTVDNDGQVYLNTYPVPKGITAVKVAELLEEMCEIDQGYCDQIFYCGSGVVSCDDLYSDEEAVMALDVVCNTGLCGQSVRIALSDDKYIITALSVGIFEGGGGGARPGPRRGPSAHGTTTYKAQLSACKNSFLPGTHVLMADGSTKPIEDVKVGDLVIATDPETSTTEARLVTHIIVGDGVKQLVQIAAKEDAHNVGSIVATDEHPFYSPGKGTWTDAEDLRAGDPLLTSGSEHIYIASTRSWSEHQKVYNLTVDGLHTYYVIAGNTPVLVHNTNGCFGNSIPTESLDVIKGIQRDGVLGQSGAMGPTVPKVFRNDGGTGGQVLPRTTAGGDAITYREWGTVPGSGNPRPGGERIVTGSDGSVYYTPDHYQTFIRY
ncbi:type IV secretion protein Rhs [Salinispora arenicola]|uniref:Intein/RHS repeat-associated protein n=2 Tax=Salinispora arenicola TaxID=168697 RepID=A0A542XLK4_SALAC|nr:intein/RHS repeat-associated protein [Salinispora arenicola]GIM87193.1 type IV secretion protein Rhs [Salinispora arenicola]